LKKETYFLIQRFPLDKSHDDRWNDCKSLNVTTFDDFKKTPHLLCPCVWWTWIWKLAIFQISCHRKSIEKSHSFSLTKDGDIAMA
jgi:hypothetical protein